MTKSKVHSYFLRLGKGGSLAGRSSVGGAWKASWANHFFFGIFLLWRHYWLVVIYSFIYGDWLLFFSLLLLVWVIGALINRGGVIGCQSQWRRSRGNALPCGPMTDEIFFLFFFFYFSFCCRLLFATRCGGRAPPTGRWAASQRRNNNNNSNNNSNNNPNWWGWNSSNSSSSSRRSRRRSTTTSSTKSRSTIRASIWRRCSPSARLTKFDLVFSWYLPISIESLLVGPISA